MERVLSGKKIVICAGPGGVGKTTSSAALAVGLAMRGQRVVVVTIDPARRLANALGLDALLDEPRRIDPGLFDEMQGELWALMLDSKRTFDSLIERVAPSEQARDEVLRNPIYVQLSSAVAGTQEFTAIAKLHELSQSDDFDVIVLDTPPSRNALDFLDAPDRLTGFLTGRAGRMFLRPGRLFGAGTAVVFSALRRATGVGLLDDLSIFFRALGGMIPELAERGSHVKALLASPDTTFLLVTSLEPEPVAETIYFHERLREAKLPFGAVIVNRVHPPVADDDEDLPVDAALAAKVAEGAAEAALLAARDADGLERLRDALTDPRVVPVPQLPGDVHDLEGLAQVGEHLFTPAV
ncbi:MAG: ArsA family ATPase [Solirubrobacteraceae bacterium]